jgi:predicted  nucleic acid-binding Zn-ribbon protein
MVGYPTMLFAKRKFSSNLNPTMTDHSNMYVKFSVRELKEKLEKAETNLDEINKAAELAFKVIKEQEKKALEEISELRNEIKRRRN